MLAPSLEPRYVVRVKRRIYVEHVGDDIAQPLVPPLSVADAAWTREILSQ
jgi:hypothetical protein